MRKILFAILLLTAACSAPADRHARQFTLDLTPDGSASLLVFLPERPSGRAVVCCPGGGYAMLSDSHEGTEWAGYFNERGIAFAVVRYRLPEGDPSLPVADVEHAMRILRDSAAVWSLNPHDIGIMGSSAGGHLASTLATHSPYELRPAFQILFYPVITMGSGTHAGSLNHLLGAGAADPALVQSYSNERQVRRHLTPPAILLLANDDRLVLPVPNAIAYYNAMRNAGNDCTLHIYPTGGHGFGIREDFAHHDQMLDDLSAWLDGLRAPAPDAIRVACIGDSITDGSGIDMSERFAYPARLQELLGEGYRVRNFGVSARTMLNKGNNPYMNELAWRDALAFQPDIVVIKLGTNDSKAINWVYGEEFAGDLRQMISTLRSLPSPPKIYLTAPIPAFKYNYGITEEIISGEIIPIIRDVAREEGVAGLIDLYAAFQGHEEWMQGDGIHPNETGAFHLAETVAAAIAPAR